MRSTTADGALGPLATLSAFAGLSALALLLAHASGRRNQNERFITRKSHLHAQGVTLQEPHIRALNSGMR